MSVKRYEANGSSSVFEDANGSLVDYSDYSELEARCLKLVAENAGLKAACGGDGSYRDCPACAHSEYIEAPETPTTDAFLAEVRAQGVEMFAKYIALYNSNSERHAQSFAAQIRKGVI